MNIYSFTQDVEVIAVRRNYFTIKADSLEEAEEIARQFKDKDIVHENLNDNDIVTYGFNNVEENCLKDFEEWTGDKPEISVYNGDGELV